MSGPPGPRARGQLRPFLRALAGSRPRQLAWVIGVQVAAALTQGIGLLLLVPLLEVAGVGAAPAGRAGGAAGPVREAFRAAGLPLTLPAALLAYVTVVALAAALGAYQNVLSARYRLAFADRLRERLCQAVAAAQWRHLLTVRRSDLLTALTTGVAWAEQGALAALSLATATVVVGVQVAVACRISPGVTGLAAGTGAVFAALAWPLAVRSRRLGRELAGHSRDALAAVTGFLDGLKLAKAHGLESGHLAGFGTAIGRARRSQIAFTRASAAATAVQLTLTAAVVAALAGMTAGRNGQPLAGLLVLAFIFVRVLSQLAQAQQHVQTLAQALPAFGELHAVTGECERAAEPRPGRGRPPAPPRSRRAALTRQLTFEDVSFSYQQPGRAPAGVLLGVNATIPAGATTALAGPSGAGKTTMADLAVALLAPACGRILLDGRPLTGELARAWRNSVAVVPQDPYLFHDTIRANLLWSRPEATDAELWQALAMASAQDLVRRLPGGLGTVVGDRGGSLSGGERQRITLARALLRRPELLVLDEATSSLDGGHEAVILDALTALGGRVTMLVISHRDAVLRRADQVVRLERGRVAGPGAAGHEATPRMAVTGPPGAARHARAGAVPGQP